MEKRPKVVAVVGPTASGKSSLAIQLAKHFNGAILSADSRQIYRGMDIGTGKVTLEEITSPEFGGSLLSSDGIIHFGINLADPKEQYSVALYKQYGISIINQIITHGFLPIICGGTGHWVDSVIYNESLPETGPNLKLRAELDKKSTDQLYLELSKLDPERAQSIDKNNRRRVMRALEINLISGKPVPPVTTTSPYDVLWIGLDVDKEQLHENIKSRLTARLENGMIDEVNRLHSEGVSWQRLENFGLEYKYCGLFLQNKLTKQELFDQLFSAIKQYAKRQMTWFKRNKEIHWIKGESEAIDLADSFLQK